MSTAFRFPRLPPSPEQEREAAASAPAGTAYARLHAMNIDWFLLDENGRLSVCRFLDDDGHGRKRLTRYTFRDFRAKFATDQVEGRSIADTWLAWPGRRQYDRVVFRPREQVGPAELNLWRGFGVTAAPGRWDLIRDHLQHVVCGGREDLFDYVVRWVARMVQRPNEPGDVAIVLRGKEGVGKSLVGRLIRRMMGQHGVAVSSARHVIGDFNGLLQDVIFLEASEAFFAGDRQGASKLKALLTDDTLTLERKGADAVEWKNRIHCLMTSNEAWVVPAGPESRRFLIIDVNDRRRTDTSYFGPLAAEIESDRAVGAFLHYLLDLDLAGFDHRNFPRTAALADQRERSLTGVLAWALDVASRQGTIQTAGGPASWRPFFATRELYEDYKAWVADQQFERPLSYATFGRELKTFSCIRFHRRPLSEHSAPALLAQAPGYAMPPSVDEFERCVRLRAGLTFDEGTNEAGPARERSP